MHTLSIQQVNIYKKPVPIEHAFKITEATIGDLHGNIIKFVYFLIKQGIILMDDAEFYRLVELYKTDPHVWTQDYIDELACAVKSFVVINKDVLVRLLGDDVADRGQLDITILWFLAEFVRQGGLVQIHVSNHGFEFITYMESYLLNPAAQEIPLERFALLGRHENQYTVSLANLHFILKKEWVSKEQVRHLYETVYRPLLRVMTYSICPTTGETHLFSHAESGLETLTALGEYFDVDCTKHTVKNIIDSIEVKNHLFQKKYASVNQITISGCYNIKEMSNPLTKFSAMAHLVWRRVDYPERIHSPGELEYDTLNPDEPPRRIKWFHGHDRYVQNPLHSFSLDCASGLPTRNHENCLENYVDLVSDHLPQAMLIYNRITLPRLQELLSDVPEASQLDLSVLLNNLWRFIYRFVVMETHLQQNDRAAFEEKRERLVKEMVMLTPHETRMDALFQEEDMLDCLKLPVKAILLRCPIIREHSVQLPGFFRGYFAQDCAQNEFQACEQNDDFAPLQKERCLIA